MQKPRLVQNPSLPELLTTIPLMCKLIYLLPALKHSESGSFSTSQLVDAIGSTVVSIKRASSGKIVTLSLWKLRSMALALESL